MGSVKNKKILIVDDEAELRNILAEEFVYFGASVKTASNGLAAIEILKSEDFDIVLSDLRMPDGDGRFLFQQINEFITSKPMIFTYAGNDDIDAEEAKHLSVTKMFQKPTSASDLIKEIEKYL